MRGQPDMHASMNPGASNTEGRRKGSVEIMLMHVMSRVKFHGLGSVSFIYVCAIMAVATSFFLE